MECVLHATLLVATILQTETMYAQQGIAPAVRRVQPADTSELAQAAREVDAIADPVGELSPGEVEEMLIAGGCDR